MISVAHLRGIHQLDSYMASESSSPIRRASSARSIPVLTNSLIVGNLLRRRTDNLLMQRIYDRRQYLITVLLTILALSSCPPRHEPPQEDGDAVWPGQLAVLLP